MKSITLYRLPNGLYAYFPNDPAFAPAFGAETQRPLWDRIPGQINEIFGPKAYNRYFELKRGMGILDLGSFIGLYTLYASLLVGPEGLVVAVEPFLPAYKALIKNIVINNLENVIPIYGAIVPRSGWLRMNINNENYRANKVVPDEYGHVPGYTFDSLKKIFDGLDKTIDFIKMDIEGGEKQLTGMMTLDIPITFEHHGDHRPYLGLRIDNLRYVNQECQ